MTRVQGIWLRGKEIENFKKIIRSFITRGGRDHSPDTIRLANALAGRRAAKKEKK